VNTDTAELGERVARALDEENTGTLAERIAAIVSRARIARLRAALRSAPNVQMTVTGPPHGDAASGEP
jgi:hypothetical protein